MVATTHVARLWWVALALVVMTGGGVSPAGAKPPSEADRAYEAAVGEAVREYEAGHWAEAAALFDEAHRLRPNARTLRGMGMTAYEARRYVDALRHLRGALEDGRKPLTEGQRRQVRGLIDKAKRFVARIRVFVTPEDAQVRLNGQRVELDDHADLLLDPGTHELTITAAGHQDLVRHLQITPGQEDELKLVLVRHDASELVHGPTTPEPMPEPALRLDATQSTPEPQRGGGRLWTWVALGSAGVFAATAGGLYLAGDAEFRSIERSCDVNQCSLQEIDARIGDSNVKTLQTLTNVSWGLSSAALVTAVVLFFVEGNAKPDRAPTTALLVGPTSVQLQAQF